MNGTDAQKPPETCCGPLREAVKNERAYLYALYASPEILKAFNINVTDMLRLSKRCGITEDVSSYPMAGILFRQSQYISCFHLLISLHFQSKGTSPTKSPPSNICLLCILKST